MKVLPASDDEPGEDLISGFSGRNGSLCVVSKVIDYVVLLVLGEEVRNFSRVEDVVDVFEELLLNNLAIAEHETELLVVDASTFCQKHSQVFMPFLLSIVFGNLD